MILESLQFIVIYLNGIELDYRIPGSLEYVTSFEKLVCWLYSANYISLKVNMYIAIYIFSFACVIK